MARSRTSLFAVCLLVLGSLTSSRVAWAADGTSPDFQKDELVFVTDGPLGYIGTVIHSSGVGKVLINFGSRSLNSQYGLQDPATLLRYHPVTRLTVADVRFPQGHTYKIGDVVTYSDDIRSATGTVAKLVEEGFMQIHLNGETDSGFLRIAYEIPSNTQPAGPIRDPWRETFRGLPEYVITPYQTSRAERLGRFVGACLAVFRGKN